MTTAMDPTTAQATASGRSTWKLDPMHSHVGFVGRQMMISTVRGRFDRFDALLELDERRPESATVQARIDADSLDTGAEYRDTHLKGRDMLGAENHRYLEFRSTRVERTGADRFRLRGELSIRGVTRPVSLDVVFHGIIEAELGERRAAFSATGELDRRDWGLTWNVPLGGDAVLVGNVVRIEIDVTFVQQAADAGAFDGDARTPAAEAG